MRRAIAFFGAAFYTCRVVITPTRARTETPVNLLTALVDSYKKGQQQNRRSGKCQASAVAISSSAAPVHASQHPRRCCPTSLTTPDTFRKAPVACRPSRSSQKVPSLTPAKFARFTSVVGVLHVERRSARLQRQQVCAASIIFETAAGPARRLLCSGAQCHYTEEAFRCVEAQSGPMI